VFIYQVNVFSKAFTGDDVRAAQEQRERMIQAGLADARDAIARENRRDIEDQ
jgi:hypothetical protein